MKNIGLVDDREEIRATTCRRIQRFLPDEWRCIAIQPFTSIESYFPWIMENAISGIVLDQRLNEVKAPDSMPIQYRGNELAKALRRKFPEIPIYSITSYAEDDEIKENFDEFEHIFAREDFRQNTEKTTRIILRGCSRYHENHSESLNRLSQLSQKAAEGGISNDEKTELASLQEYLNLPSSFQYDASISELINSISNDTDKLESLLKKIEKGINK